MTLVPVTINYERVFEIRNIVTDMVSGDLPSLSLFQLSQMIGKSGDGKLGRIFLNFGNPINLKDYLANINVKSLDSSNIDECSLRLTEKLYKEQQLTTHINLNMLVAIQLL
jgi:glycerol-3-phosphate O-acyltransferase